MKLMTTDCLPSIFSLREPSSVAATCSATFNQLPAACAALAPNYASCLMSCSVTHQQIALLPFSRHQLPRMKSALSDFFTSVIKELNSTKT